jgi:hypothetical protein
MFFCEGKVASHVSCLADFVDWYVGQAFIRKLDSITGFYFFDTPFPFCWQCPWHPPLQQLQALSLPL